MRVCSAGRAGGGADRGPPAALWPCVPGPLEKAVRDLGAERVVVLSPDATEPLTSLAPGTAVVIAGFVDRPCRPGVSLERAVSSKWQALRLPVREHSGLPLWLFQDVGSSGAGARVACGEGDARAVEESAGKESADVQEDEASGKQSSVMAKIDGGASVARLLQGYSSRREASEAAQVLSVNAVVASLLTFSSTQNWRSAIEAALPKRLKRGGERRMS